MNKNDREMIEKNIRDNYYGEIIIYEAQPFESISEFKQCMEHGGELVFEWKGQRYCAFRNIWFEDKPGGRTSMYISETNDKKTSRELWCDTPDELLEYMVGGDKLRDVVTQIEVLDRPF